MTAPAPVMLRLAALDRWLAGRAQGYWAQLQPDALQASFVSDVLPALVPDVIAAQMTAAQIGAQSVAAADPGAAEPDTAFLDQVGLSATDYAALGVTPDPGAFAGFAGDGRLLGQSLSSGLVQTYSNLQRGVDPSLALASGFDQLDETMTTAVQDSARTASGTAIASSAQWTGYIRVVEPGACDRCVILAGKFYRWSKGFLRHPNCRCINSPISGENVPPQDPNELFDNMTPAEQDRGFTANGAQAIRDGADISQVVNSRLGIAEAGTTLQGTTRRAWTSTVQREIASQQGLSVPRGRIGPPRLLPEEIYRRAGEDRSEALRLLIGNGYLVGDTKGLSALYLRLSRTAVDLSNIGA